MNKIQRYFRLRKICKALGIKKLCKWQKDFIYCQSHYMPRERGIGKTTAVVIRVLLAMKNSNLNEKVPIAVLIADDPDFLKNKMWHFYNFYKCYKVCIANKVKFPDRYVSFPEIYVSPASLMRSYHRRFDLGGWCNGKL